MKSTFAVALAAATGALAGHNVTYVTEVVETYVTYCPEPTEVTIGTQTFTVTEPTTLTVTDCGCTVTKPVIPTSTVICHDCPEEPTAILPPPPHTNATIPGVPQPTGAPVPPPSGEEPEEPPAPAPTAGAAKIAGLSGVAGLAGLAAFFL